jgi:hypothetical protein
VSFGFLHGFGMFADLRYLRTARLTIVGQHNYRNSHSSHHRSIQGTERCRLVRIGLPAHDLRNTTPLRQILHLLLHQVGLHHRPLHLRSRLPDLRCCAQLDRSHHRSCRRWRWCCRHLQRCYPHHCLNCTSASTPSLHGSNRWYVRHCVSRWTLGKWSSERVQRGEVDLRTTEHLLTKLRWVEPLPTI